jgi:hypothetical protein
VRFSDGWKNVKATTDRLVNPSENEDLSSLYGNAAYPRVSGLFDLQSAAEKTIETLLELIIERMDTYGNDCY